MSRRPFPPRMTVRSLMLAILCLAISFHYLVASRRRSIDVQIAYCSRSEALAAEVLAIPSAARAGAFYRRVGARAAADRARLTALRRSWWPWTRTAFMPHPDGCLCGDCPNDPSLKGAWNRTWRHLPAWAIILIREGNAPWVAGRIFLAAAAAAALVAVLRGRRGRARGPVAEAHAGSTHRGL